MHYIYKCRTESKLSLLAEMRDFFKKRGEVELEYAKNLERVCERFEKSTKQRNIRLESHVHVHVVWPLHCDSPVSVETK